MDDEAGRKRCNRPVWVAATLPALSVLLPLALQERLATIFWMAASIASM
jgi:hypothetical protein